MSYLSEGNDGRSPFELPRTFYYEEVNDYYLKKAGQLLNVRNFDLAAKELNGLLECAVRNDDSHSILKLKKMLLQNEQALSLREELRAELRFQTEAFLKDKTKWSSLRDSLQKFLLESEITEEYSGLISIIINDCLNSEIGDLPEKLSLLQEYQPLKYLIKVAEIEARNNKEYFLLFDLDSTLFDNSPRVYRIIRDFIKEHGADYPEDIGKLTAIKREDIIWGIKENLKKAEIFSEKITDHVINYWFERFFSNEYIIDVPLQGACQFVKDAQDAGLRIVYLTGRFETMREGTARNLREHSFPLDDDQKNLILKPDRKIPDHVFKHQVMEDVKNLGNMLAGFENEPVNANIFQEHFPDSMVFFLETNHSLNPPNLFDNIHTIDNFDY